MKQPWNACRIWSRLGYSGRKAVVFLPIEISLGVVLNTCIPVVILCWAITQFIPHLWYISHKALVTDDTMFSSVESSEGKATPRGAKFHFLRAFSSVAYEIHPRNSPSPLPLTQVPFSLLQAAVWSSFNPNNVLTQDQEPMKLFPLCSLLHQDWKCCGYVPAAAGT